MSSYSDFLQLYIDKVGKNQDYQKQVYQKCRLRMSLVYHYHQQTRKIPLQLQFAKQTLPEKIFNILSSTKNQTGFVISLTFLQKFGYSNLTFNASTQCGRDLHVSNSPCPSCPRRPSPHVNTICSLVNAMICEPLTLT